MKKICLSFIYNNALVKVLFTVKFGDDKYKFITQTKELLTL